MNPQELREKILMFYKDAPISEETIKALSKRGFYKLTEIQRCTLIPSL